MAESRAQEYKAKLDELVAQAVALPADARAAVLKQLRDAVDSIDLDLAKFDPSSYSASRLRGLKQEINRVMGSFAQAATSELNKAERAMYREASRNVTQTVQIATGSTIVQPVIDTHILAVAQGYSADLVTGLSQETAAKINGALQRAVLGKLDNRQLVAQIGGTLEGGTFSGLFSPAAARAASITTNEVLRIHSLASMARLTDLSRRHDGIEKEWWHIPVAKAPRPAHVLASGQTRPVDQPFDIAGEQLMYPRDPSGSADNTIYCHCLVRTKVNPALLKPSDLERAALERHGVSVTTQRT